MTVTWGHPQRCELCKFWDEPNWGCRQHGISVSNADPHFGAPAYAIAWGKRRSNVNVTVGPSFGCLHWEKA